MSRVLASWWMGLAALLAAAPSIALDQGEFSNGLYIAPGELFTVQSPLGANPLVIDSFNRSTGAVTFVDDEGALFGIVCTPSYDVLAGADNDTETNYAILRNWLRDATFPNFFESQLPGAGILHGERVELEGQPAWFGVVRLPRGAARFPQGDATGVRIRADSYGGLVVFSRGDLTFLLITAAEPVTDRQVYLAPL